MRSTSFLQTSITFSWAMVSPALLGKAISQVYLRLRWHTLRKGCDPFCTRLYTTLRRKIHAIVQSIHHVLSRTCLSARPHTDRRLPAERRRFKEGIEAPCITLPLAFSPYQMSPLSTFHCGSCVVWPLAFARSQARR